MIVIVIMNADCWFGDKYSKADKIYRNDDTAIKLIK